MTTTNDIRTAFLSYFKKYGHEVVASSSLIPHNDPTLLFTNAGMVQFKNIFTGLESRSYKRAATAQKCVRAGGKHNDLDSVGYTSRHHTFFEMLGNFSFGDYFKDTAIELAWGLITQELSLSTERLLVTVHAADEEAAVLWNKIAGLPETRIIRLSAYDNFWQMGDIGPCGPCSEIFYDHGPGIPGGPPGSADENGDRFVEIWNLVFMQFEQRADGTQILLPRPSIDTGMGLERMAAVLQGQHDNYDTDLMRSLIKVISYITRTDPDGPHRTSHRVIADHLRSSSFLIADGVFPANEGRGYVLRRILRRAMRHVHMMGVRTLLLWQLVPTLIEYMGMVYPELVQAAAIITDTLKLEEERFIRTLERGMKLLDEQSTGLQPGDTFSGAIAFKLYDTYGFPLDLTQDLLHDRAITVDTKEFDAAMVYQKTEARKAWIGSGEATIENVWFNIQARIGATEFLGYDSEEAKGLLTALVVDGRTVEQAEIGMSVMLLADRTPFYGESGGQVGDSGHITVPNKGRIAVDNTLRKLGILHVHVGLVEEGVITVGDVAHFAVNKTQRAILQANHSATHLLHAALRHVLGKHVTQRGSLVATDRLRFDVSYPRAISPEKLREIESLVNQYIRANEPVFTRLTDKETAVRDGAIALFGEKYSKEVRVVTIGGHNIFSVELCGGIHVHRTGDIGMFHILSESTVAAGVRRIEAVTGAAVEAIIAEQSMWLSQVADILKIAPANVPVRVAALVEERSRLEREIVCVYHKLALAEGTAVREVVKQIKGVTFAVRHLKGTPAKDLKRLADNLKRRLGSGIIAIVSDSGSKASIVVGVTDDLSGQISAIDLARAGAEALGGRGGGGRRDLAQAGGPDATAAAKALQAIEHLLSERIRV